MKDNLMAKFSDIILSASQKEINKNIAHISFLVDGEIDNPSNTNAVDCQKFFKENTRNNKKTEKEAYSSSSSSEVYNQSKKFRYTLENFIVG